MMHVHPRCDRVFLASPRRRFFCLPPLSWRQGSILCLAVVLGLATSLPAAAASLTVVVTNLKNDKGLVRLALYDNAESFPENGKSIAKIDRPISEGMKDGVFTATFEDLAPGPYAVAFFHDEDGDNTFAQNVFGMPHEGFGFSRDAAVLFSAPDFSDAAVEVPEDGARITVRMRYWGGKARK